jgi:hypothetical protein
MICELLAISVICGPGLPGAGLGQRIQDGYIPCSLESNTQDTPGQMNTIVPGGKEPE